MRLSFDAAAPEAGADLTAGDTPVGAGTSTAGALALARVRVDRLAKALAAGETLAANGAMATLLDDLSADERA